MLNLNNFIKYIKEFGFPNKNYNAIKDYPSTIMVTNRVYLNEFSKKYNKKFIFSYKDENILSNSNDDILFYKSLEFISNFQKTLYNKNIKSYISGGSSVKLYSLVNNYNFQNKNIFKTPDFDIQLYDDNDKSKLTNIIILNNLETIINSISINIKDQYKNNSVLKIFSVMNLNNRKELLNILEYFLNLNYDLYKYRINKDKEDNDYMYYLDFIKKKSNTSYIILNLKFKKKLSILEKCDGYSYIKINTCITYKNILYYIYSPIDITSHYKNNLNIKLIQGNIIYNNHNFYVLNKKSVLYNLINMYYHYQNSLNNKLIIKKKEEQKNKRDNKRLYYFFKFYCNLFYKNMNDNDINKTLDLIKLKNNKFNICLYVLKDLNILDEFFKEYQ